MRILVALPASGRQVRARSRRRLAHYTSARGHPYTEDYTPARGHSHPESLLVSKSGRGEPPSFSSTGHARANVLRGPYVGIHEAAHGTCRRSGPSPVNLTDRGHSSCIYRGRKLAAHVSCRSILGAHPRGPVASFSVSAYRHLAHSAANARCHLRPAGRRARDVGGVEVVIHIILCQPSRASKRRGCVYIVIVKQLRNDLGLERLDLGPRCLIFMFV